MRKLSVIQLVSAEYDWGGIEQYAKDVAQGLIARDHKVLVAARDVEFFVKMYQTVCPVYTFPIRNSIDPQSIFGLARLIRKENVDIIHTHTSRDAWMALFATFVAGRGKVVTTRHVPLAAKRDKLHTWYYRKLAAIICVSDYVRNIFLGPRPLIDPSKVRTIYPVINFEKFSVGITEDIRKKFGITAGEFVVGFVGRITREKGLADLIRAIAELRNRQPGVRLLVVGDVNPMTPDYLDEIKSLCRELKLADIVDFHGFARNIQDFMYAFDALVLPSVTPETFGLVLAEAMICGKPVVATNTGAQGEFVQEGVSGYLVPPASPGAIAGALEKLVSDPAMAIEMGLKNKKVMNERFSNASTMESIEKCYFECLEN